MANAAIGSRISLISKSEIRYEGFLDHINTQENHVGLKNVRMFGTEGRKGGAGEVPASDNLYEFIIFRGGDIKDLSVFENQPRDPAIVNSKTSTATVDNNSNNNNAGSGSKSAWASGPPSGLRTAGGQQTLTVDDQGRNDRNSRGRYNNHRGGGNHRGGYNNNYNNNYNNHHNNNGRGGFQHSRPVQHTGQDFQVPSDAARAQEQVGTDFDFGKAQQEFEQAKQQAHEARASANAAGKKYEKKEFFDTLKPEEKNAPNPNFQARRMEREQQNAVDADTFGSDMVAVQHTRGFGRGRGRGNGRGGGRGYRGGRGYHRGGYNNHNQQQQQQPQQ